MSGFIAALRPFGLASGTAGFNLDFHAIRHHGTDAIWLRLPALIPVLAP